MNHSYLCKTGQTDVNALCSPVRSVLKKQHFTRPRSYSWKLTEPIFQEDDYGACVGFAWTNLLRTRPFNTMADADFAIEKVYWEAQKLDKWPGGVYPGAAPLTAGTSVWAGGRALQLQGYLKNYFRVGDISELVATLGYHGPCIFGTRWYQRMSQPDRNGFIKPGGKRRTSHCLLAVGIKISITESGELDLAASYVTFVNSWKNWGDKGRCKMRLSDVSQLMEHAEIYTANSKVTTL